MSCKRPSSQPTLDFGFGLDPFSRPLVWVVAFLSIAGYGWGLAEQPGTDLQDWFFGACLMLTAVVGA